MSTPLLTRFRALRLFIPVVVIALALGLFLSVGLIISITQRGSGLGGPCDPSGYSSIDGSISPVTTPDQLSDDQRQNAGLIIAVARQMGMPPRAWTVALATAMQESALHNLPYGDRDSLGLFQQRPSQGWGTPAQVSDPVYATTAFLNRLRLVPGWDTLPLTVAAQVVQRSAFPEAYARWEGLATQLVAVLANVIDPSGCGLGAVNLPEGVVRTAVTFALQQVGKPYVWGATGPNAFDCSGLMLRAFQAAGIYLPRVAREQYRAGGHVPATQAQPGDLLFLASDRRDPATIHHVMLYLGNGMLAEAPYRGQPVRTRPVDWNDPELVSLATRPGTLPNPAT